MYICVIISIGLVATISGTTLPKCSPGYYSLGHECDIPAHTDCPVEQYCSGDGQCFMSPGATRVFCNCSSTRFGDMCQFTVDSHTTLNCSEYPCKNNGRCVQSNGGFLCACPPGFRGQLCDIETRIVTSETRCEHGGTPYTQGNYTGCVCPCGWSGRFCELIDKNVVTYPRKCKELFCNGHGVCVATKTAVACICDVGYSGKFCSVLSKADKLNSSSDRKPCDRVICYNGGTCYNKETQQGSRVYLAKCLCPLKFFGNSCEYSIDISRADYINKCKYYNITCNNRGTCYVDSKTGKTGCNCQRGYVGSNCSYYYKCGPYVGCAGHVCPPGTTCIEIGACWDPFCHKSDFTTPAITTERPKHSEDDTDGEDETDGSGIGIYIAYGIVPYMVFVLCILICCKKRHRMSALDAYSTGTNESRVDVSDTSRLHPAEPDMRRETSFHIYHILSYGSSPDTAQNMDLLSSEELRQTLSLLPGGIQVTRLPRYSSITSVGCPPKYVTVPTSGQSGTTRRSSSSSLTSERPPPYEATPTFYLTVPEDNPNRDSLNSISPPLPLPPNSDRYSATVPRDNFTSVSLEGLPPPFEPPPYEQSESNEASTCNVTL